MSKRSKIIERIEAEAGLPGLCDALTQRVSGSGLQSLLLDVLRDRVSSGLPASAFSRLLPPLLQPSAVDARLLLDVDRAAFAAAAGFEAIDLSPVNALGATRTLGGQSQNNLLSTIRNAEVLGDPTIAMSILAATRRRVAHRPAVKVERLCASHRVVRLQPLDFPGFTPHFRLFGMISAGRDTGSSGFELAELREHVRVFLRLFRILNQEAGFRIGDPLVEFADTRIVNGLLAAQGVPAEEIRANIRAHWPGGTQRFLSEKGIRLSGDSASLSPLLADLQDEYPEARFVVNQERLEGLGYYSSYTLRISPLAPDGQRYPLADGGITDWTARMLEDRKERLLISGIGTEFLCKKFRHQPC